MNPSLQKIKICIISLGAYPLFQARIHQTFGGAEVQLYLLAQELAQNTQYEVHFVVGDYGQEKKERINNITLYKSISVEKKKKRGLERFYPKKGTILAHILREIDADIYIQRSASAGTGLVCMVAHLLKKKFIYMTAHEIDCNGAFEQQNSWLAGKLFQYGIRKAAVVITQSDEHAEMIKKHHKRSSIVIPSLYSIPKEDELSHIQKKHILWVGRCEDWKRPEIFIELAKLHPEEQFIMISPASNNQSAYYQQLTQQLREAPKNLRHIPYVPFAEIDQYFKEAKLFINTSTYEGFPNTFIQAIKNKTPILSLTVNPDQFLEKAGCGISLNNNILLLQKKLSSYLSDPTALETLSKSGYAYAKKYHSTTEITKKYTKLFQDVLKTYNPDTNKKDVGTFE